mmetsp:Transcript_54436/g.127298  ORF Transcript_54436/g.127298 Transcript_54436/m.127298 type:complete len:160 (-) Transcript_54436:248-727(-)
MDASEFVTQCKKSVDGAPSCKEASLMANDDVVKGINDTTVVMIEGGTTSLVEAGWTFVEEPYPRLVKKFEWPKNKKTSFQHPWKFVDVVAEMAEEAGHHPDISFGWGYANIVFTTHWIKGCSSGDIFMAAKVEEAHRLFLKNLPAPTLTPPGLTPPSKP